MERFAGKTIVLTGASEGIGRALAVALSPQRPNLVLAARNGERLAEVAERCQARGASTLCVPTDVTDVEACRTLIETAVERFTYLDVLVNNAGMSMWCPAKNITDFTIFDRLMRVNYLGAVSCTLCALPHLAKRRGHVVALSSAAGVTGVPGLSGYCATKHALIGFFESLRIELTEDGVDVTIVAPDFVQSNIYERSFGGSGEPLQRRPPVHDEFLTAEACAEMMVRGMERRERLVTTSARTKWGRWVKLLWPTAIDRVAARASRKVYGSFR